MSDPGYFPPGQSALRRVHSERLVGLFYGQRALCIGALKPLNYVGTTEHTKQPMTPFRRLVHTAKAFETIYFGSRADADRVLRAVAAMHARVRGELPEDAGPWPAGTPYDALDPELMLWTVAAIADSATCFYELFVRRLSEGEREALWQDYLRFGELFGLPRSACPASWMAFRAWWQGELASDRLFLTPEARRVGHATAFEIPLPGASQPGKRVHDAIMLGSLPRRVREMYGLAYGARERAAFEAGALALRGGRRLIPRRLARGSCAAQFDLVAATERSRIARGEPTPQVRDEPLVC